LPASIRRRIAVLGFLRSSASTDADTKHPQSSSPASPTYEEIDEPAASVRSGSANQYELERATSDGTASPSSAARDSYALQPTAPADSLYSKPYRPRPRPPPAVSAAAVPARNERSPEYRDTSTTLVDNPLYYVAQRPPPVTSSNLAYAGGDVTDLTVIDNDLYEREDDGQGQQNLGFAEYECTLVDNDLYR